MLIVAVSIFSAGINKLVPSFATYEQLWQQFVDFGYSKTFFTITGVIEVAAAFLILLRPTRTLGAFLIIATMMGAAYSNFGVGAYNFLPVNVMLALLAAVVAWLDRRHSVVIQRR